MVIRGAVGPLAPGPLPSPPPRPPDGTSTTSPRTVSTPDASPEAGDPGRALDLPADTSGPRWPIFTTDTQATATATSTTPATTPILICTLPPVADASANRRDTAEGRSRATPVLSELRERSESQV